MWGFRFPPGHTSSISFMAHTREALRCLHHPLFFYAWGAAVGTMSGLVLRSWGLKVCTRSVCAAFCLTPGCVKSVGGDSRVGGWQRFSTEGRRMHYWYRGDPTEEGEEGEAVVFLHGLGVGITPYLSFLDMLSKSTHGKLVVVELPYVGLQFAPSVPTADEVVEELERIHTRHGVGRACYLGHSYGSLIIANVSPSHATCRLPPPPLTPLTLSGVFQMVRTHSERVSSLGLADPVCFLLCLPDVVFNFVYR